MKAALCDYIEHEILGNGPDGKQLNVQTSDDLLGIGMLDSIKLMRLVQHIEETNQISIPAEDMVLENFRTVDAIASYLEARD